MCVAGARLEFDEQRSYDCRAQWLNTKRDSEKTGNWNLSLPIPLTIMTCTAARHCLFLCSFRHLSTVITKKFQFTMFLLTFHRLFMK